jgi:hypothetical protein
MGADSCEQCGRKYLRCRDTHLEDGRSLVISWYISIPCSLKTIPSYALGNSLFRCVGNSAVSYCICVLIRRKNRGGWPDSVKFPVNFPVSREFAAETSSQLTASSASQSGLHYPTCQKRSEPRGTAAFRRYRLVSACEICRGSAIPAPCLRGPFLVSRFLEPYGRAVPCSVSTLCV